MLKRRTKSERLRRLFHLYGRLMSKSSRYLWSYSDDHDLRMLYSKLQEMYFDRALKVQMKFLELTREPFRKSKFVPNTNTPPIRYVSEEKIVEMMTR